MTKSNVQFTKDNEYYTPKDFVARFGKFADIPDGVIVRIWFRIIKGSSLDWCIYSEYKDCSGM